MKKIEFQRLAIVLTASVFLTACGRKGGEGGTETLEGQVLIQNAGSDTMVNLAQAWAETYAGVEPGVSVEVSGGGSGTGIAALINGTTDIANCSRQMTDEEIARAKERSGKEPKEHVLGYDALAVYVHKDNPLDEITLPQLAEIYGEGGTITKWTQLGIENQGCSNDEIIRVSRQSSSGTFAYFRETVLGENRDYKLGSRDMHGSKEVVELVASTPCAIGYSGMGYATDEVKMLRIAVKEGEPAYAPTLENTVNKTYPIARPLFMYTLGEPEGEVKKYIDWCHSSAGQKIVRESGYVPITAVEE